MRLSHFSQQSNIELFEPRSVVTPVKRPVGQEWLNGPLVWAIDEPHSILYLFPRECPRILLWPTARTTQQDQEIWLGNTDARVVAYVEEDWRDRIENTTIFRYEMPQDLFESVGDIGMWVSRSVVRPTTCDFLDQLPKRLATSGVELRTLTDLTALRSVWDTTLHASGIRLRNAQGWGQPGWPHSKSV